MVNSFLLGEFESLRNVLLVLEHSKDLDDAIVKVHNQLDQLQRIIYPVNSFCEVKK